MGYNGSAPGEAHCEDVGCLIGEDGRCKRTIHAEINAIAGLGFSTIVPSALELWCTHHPCLDCVKVIIAFGIRKVRFFIDYSNPDLIQYMSQLTKETPLWIERVEL
jgi:dCMP deaminase